LQSFEDRQQREEHGLTTLSIIREQVNAQW